MSIINEKLDIFIKICEEVLEKTKKMHNTLKQDYLVISEDGCSNAYNYFLYIFEVILRIIKEQQEKHGKVILDSDSMFNIIYSEYRVKIILKINFDEEGKLMPHVIYTNKDNGEQVFSINRETKEVTKPSAATYVDTPFDLMLTIVLNGLRAILENLDYVTDSEILEYAKSIFPEEDRERDIIIRLINMMEEKTYDQ